MSCVLSLLCRKSGGSHLWLPVNGCERLASSFKELQRCQDNRTLEIGGARRAQIFAALVWRK
jgi:hypothetical protein